MRSLNLKLKNSKFMITNLEPHSSDPVEHDHGDDYQVTIPLSGTPFIELNKKASQLNPQVRTITAPGEKHIHYTGDTNSKILLINLNKDFIDQVLTTRFHGKLQETLFSSFSEGSSEKLIKLAEDMIRKSLFLLDDPVAVDELEWELAETLLTLQEGAHSETWRREVVLNHHPLIKKVCSYVYENYQSTITLEDLTEESGMSKFYFIRTFKEVMGCTPGQFITLVRLEKAAEYLKTTNLGITTICYQMGFGSLSSFERAFKKRFGITVTEFRKRT